MKSGSFSTAIGARSRGAVMDMSKPAGGRVRIQLRAGSDSLAAGFYLRYGPGVVGVVREVLSGFSRPFVSFMDRVNISAAASDVARSRLNELQRAAGGRLPDPQVRLTEEGVLSCAWRLGDDLRVMLGVASDGKCDWFMLNRRSGESQGGEAGPGNELPGQLLSAVRHSTAGS